MNFGSCWTTLNSSSRSRSSSSSSKCNSGEIINVIVNTHVNKVIRLIIFSITYQ